MNYVYYRYLDHYLFSTDQYDLPGVNAEEALNQADRLFLLKKQPPLTANATFALTHPAMLIEDESTRWLDENRLDAAQSFMLDGRLQQLIAQRRITVVNTAYPDWQKRLTPQETLLKKRAHLLALGNVGSNLLLGLKLLGGDCLSRIGIYDLNDQLCLRWRDEMNQIAYPWHYDALPEVEILSAEDLFNCDVFIFCAAKGVPPVGEVTQDVRMAQLEVNATIIKHYAVLARQADFQGLFAVVSDPVDPLCRIAFLASNQDASGHLDFLGLRPEQIQGYGLGVMNSRAADLAKKDDRFARFLTEGRVYGPHGRGLIVADSIKHYNDSLSLELTQLTTEANLKIRASGYKPFVAPALASGTIPILQTLRGQWHYSANFLGGVYFGAKNRTTAAGLEIEAQPLPEKLYQRIIKAHRELSKL